MIKGCSRSVSEMLAKVTYPCCRGISLLQLDVHRIVQRNYLLVVVNDGKAICALTVLYERQNNNYAFIAVRNFLYHQAYRRADGGA